MRKSWLLVAGRRAGPSTEVCNKEDESLSEREESHYTSQRRERESGKRVEEIVVADPLGTLTPCSQSPLLH